MVAINDSSPQRQPCRPRFLLGQTCATPGAIEAMEQAGQAANEFFDRHVMGDWGEVEDAATNEQALDEGNRLMSVYRLRTGDVIWVVTEADRSVTTILLPDGIEPNPVDLEG